MEGITKHGRESSNQHTNNQDEAAARSLASLSANTGQESEHSVPDATTPSQDADPSPSPSSPATSPLPEISPPLTAHQQREERMKHETERTCELLREIWYEAERNDALLMANRVQTDSVLPELRLQRMRGINLSLEKDQQVLKRKGVQQEAEQMQRAREVRFREAENDRVEMEIEDMRLEVVERAARLHRQ